MSEADTIAANFAASVCRDGLDLFTICQHMWYDCLPRVPQELMAMAIAPRLQF